MRYGCRSLPLWDNTVVGKRRFCHGQELQGFPDWWCDGLGTPDPSEDDIAYWREVFETHAKAIGKTTKPKSDAQIRKWLQNPQSDSAEYKMWGNGVALPNVFFVLAGIKYYSDLSQK